MQSCENLSSLDVISDPFVKAVISAVYGFGDGPESLFVRELIEALEFPEPGSRATSPDGGFQVREVRLTPAQRDQAGLSIGAARYLEQASSWVFLPVANVDVPEVLAVLVSTPVGDLACVSEASALMRHLSQESGLSQGSVYRELKHAVIQCFQEDGRAFARERHASH